MNNNFDRSNETHHIFTALAKFQEKVPAAKLDAEVKVKTKDGRGYGFKYATLSCLVETARKHLASNGLAVTQLLSGRNLRTYLTHTSGQFLGAEAEIPFTPADAQKFGSLISYFRRYSYAAILGLVNQDDEDGNVASGNEYQKTAPPLAKAAPGKVVASTAQRKLIYALGAELGYSGDETKDIVKAHFKLDSFTKLKMDQAKTCIESLQTKKVEKQNEPEKENPF